MRYSHATSVIYPSSSYSGIERAGALACRTPCYRYYPEALEQPWVTVSDKSSAVDIPRQWSATGLANTVCMGAP